MGDRTFNWEYGLLLRCARLFLLFVMFCLLMSVRLPQCVFFFQAEDGIRDDLVTGVQTCALPICCEDYPQIGVIEPVSRGLYRLVVAPSLENPDLVAVAPRVPKGLVCLISALTFQDRKSVVEGKRVDLGGWRFI